MLDLQLVSEQLFILATETPGSDKHKQAMQHLALFDAVSMHDELVVLHEIVRKFAATSPLRDIGDAETYWDCNFCSSADQDDDGVFRADDHHWVNRNGHQVDCLWLAVKKAVDG